MASYDFQLHCHMSNVVTNNLKRFQAVFHFRGMEFTVKSAARSIHTFSLPQKVLIVSWWVTSCKWPDKIWVVCAEMPDMKSKNSRISRCRDLCPRDLFSFLINGSKPHTVVSTDHSTPKIEHTFLAVSKVMDLEAALKNEGSEKFCSDVDLKTTIVYRKDCYQ